MRRNYKVRTTRVWPTGVLGPLAIATACLLVSCDEDRPMNTSASGTALDFNFQLVNGRYTYAGHLLGQVVMLDFWDTWCLPCILEQEDLNRLYDEYHDEGFTIVGISLARHGESEVAEYLAEREVQYPSGVFGANVEQLHDRPQFIPTKLLINRDGEIVETLVGGYDYDYYAWLVSNYLED